MMNKKHIFYFFQVSFALNLFIFSCPTAAPASLVGDKLLPACCPPSSDTPTLHLKAESISDLMPFPQDRLAWSYGLMELKSSARS